MATADNFMWDPDKVIQGETSDDFFSAYKAFEISHWSFSVSNGKDTEDEETGGGGTDSTTKPGAKKAVAKPASSQGVIAGKMKFNAVTINKVVDSATALLYKSCCNETPIPSFIMATRRASGEGFIYLQYMFREVYVTQISWEGASGAERPTEVLTLNYKALGLQYVQQLPNGYPTAPKYWDWNVVKLTADGKGTPTLDIVDGHPVPPYAVNTIFPVKR